MLMSNTARAAKLHYMPNGFRVLAPGDHVVCAVSGERIPVIRQGPGRCAFLRGLEVEKGGLVGIGHGPEISLRNNDHQAGT